ncbi:MAG: ATP-binding protein [Snowella sp.]|nr:ATP-binding protein [Snowella sp.]
MSDLLEKIFSTGSYIPHGHCYLWQSELIWLHIVSDSLIALAYYSIPLTLVYFVYKRKDLPFDWIFLLFGAFIISCGTTHLMAVWTLWYPIYWLSGILKAITALISIYTAITLVELMPLALALPSPTQLTLMNQQLEQQIRDRQQAEEQVRELNRDLEAKVAQRTAELKQSMNQVQDYVERTALAMEAAQMGSWDWDLNTQKITWSHYHEILWGDEPGTPERTYEDWIRRIRTEDLSRVEAAVQQAKLNHSNFSEEYRITWEDGTEHWMVSYGRYYYNYEGEPFRVMGMVQEITDRKMAEVTLQEQARQLNEINTQLMQTTELVHQRNQELDRFSYIVSHDLKAPLRAVANLSQWIEEDLGEQIPQETQHHFQLLRSRIARMDNLINGLLTYARSGYQSVTVVEFSLNELLLEIIDSLNIPPHCTVKVPPNPLILKANRLMLSQVFTNLIGNAIKYNDRPDKAVKITAQIQAQDYRFSVADNGPGIPPEYQERIFEIFQTYNDPKQQEGTGIGLAIIKKIIERVGGQIELESKLGTGTIFHFTWPISPLDTNGYSSERRQIPELTI